MKDLRLVYEIEAAVEEVWSALTDSEYIEGWGAGDAKMKAQAGFKFKLWDGDIWGVNTEVVSEKKLVQDWYTNNWDQASVVTFNLTAKGKNQTELELIQQNIPDSDVDDIEEGWKKYYLGPIKKYLED